MSYTPTPGTIPHRVIAWLQTQPVGSEHAPAVICDALGLDSQSFSTNMALARKAGVVCARPVPGQRFNVWSLGDGTPERPPADFEPDQPLHPSGATATFTPRPAPSPFAIVAQRVEQPEPQQPAEEGREPQHVAADAPSEPFRVGLWNDGQLELRGAKITPEGHVLLTPEQLQAVRNHVSWAPPC